MKKTIMLAILISFAFGQITESEVITKEERCFPIGSVAVVETEFEITFELEPIKIWHLLEYAEECYNDSIYMGDRYIHNESYYGDGRLLATMTSEFRYDDETYWKTRPISYIRVEEIYEPTKPTFEGFIEWIKTRRNK